MLADWDENIEYKGSQIGSTMNVVGRWKEMELIYRWKTN